MRGEIVTLKPERGFGFIRSAGHADIFVHATECASGLLPVLGSQVEFEVEPTPKGVRAINVRVVQAA